MLLNGGVGKRIGAKVPKQFIRLKNIPTFIYSLRVADALEEVDEVVMNYPEGWKDDIKDVVSKYAISTPIKYVPAGTTRQESVRLMLDAVETESVLIHEAARPLVEASDFRALLEHKSKNISFTLPLSFTVLKKKSEKDFISKILQRNRLVNIQLPQKFDTQVLREAHGEAMKNGKEFTEDASLVFAAGHKVQIVSGSDRNIKITTPLDVQIASFLLNAPEEFDFDVE